MSKYELNCIKKELETIKQHQARGEEKKAYNKTHDTIELVDNILKTKNEDRLEKTYEQISEKIRTAKKEVEANPNDEIFGKYLGLKEAKAVIINKIKGEHR